MEDTHLFNKQSIHCVGVHNMGHFAYSIVCHNDPGPDPAELCGFVRQ